MIVINVFILSILSGVLSHFLLNLPIWASIVVFIVACALLQYLVTLPVIRVIMFWIFGIVNGCLSGVFICLILKDTVFKESSFNINDNYFFLGVVCVVMSIIFMAINKNGADNIDTFKKRDK